jgi:hypothetical protein
MRGKGWFSVRRVPSFDISGILESSKSLIYFAALPCRILTVASCLIRIASLKNRPCHKSAKSLKIRSDTVTDEHEQR